MAHVTDLQHAIVYRDPERKWNAAFPEIAQLSTGDLVVAFRQAPFPPTSGQTDRPHRHADPRARGAILRSTDGGQTWDLASFRLLAEVSPDLGGVEQMSVSAASGDLLLAPYAELRPQRTRSSVWVRRSTDGGDAWDEATLMGLGPLSSAAVHAPMLELPDGTLLSPHCGGIGTTDVEQKQHVQTVIRSHDRGRTWGDGSIITLDPSGRRAYHQCSLVRMADGELLAAMHSGEFRTAADGQGVRVVGLWLCRSGDDGRTWSPLEQLPLRIDGAAHHLLGLRDGRLLCVWGHRGDPSIRAAVSDDRGRSWDTTRGWPLREGPHFMEGTALVQWLDGPAVPVRSSDIGEPCSTQLPDGRVVTVYYWGDRKDAPLYIEAAMYRVI